MKRIVMITLFCLILAGCGTTKYIAIETPVSIPAPPKALAVDDGKVDKNKFPNTTWVKKPELVKNIVNKEQKAAWSFEDIDKISKSCTEWSDWTRSVDEIVGEHNRSAAAAASHTKESNKPWYKFW
jgi:hypothetical protein